MNKPLQNNPSKDKPRALLVEDNQTNQLLGLKMLEKIGCVVSQAANGRLAVDALRDQPIDIIFMDCEMPVMNGFDATREIRSQFPALNDTPIIALTAHVTPENHKACLDAGMNDFLAKPITLANLKRILEKWIAGATIELPEAPTRCLPAGAPTKSADDSSKSTSFPIYDPLTIQNLREAGGMSLLKTLYNGFSREVPTILAEIREAYSEKQLDRIRRAAHRLRGSCLSFGAQKFAEHCRTIETHALLGDISNIEPAIKALDDIFAETIKEFSLLLSQSHA